MSQYKPMPDGAWDRMGVMSVSPEFLSSLFAFPEGTTVVGIEMIPGTEIIKLYLRGPSLPKRECNEDPQRVHPSWTMVESLFPVRPRFLDWGVDPAFAGVSKNTA